MAYCICFLISIVTLIWAVGQSDSEGPVQMLMVSLIAVGNGGYWALSNASNFEEALLANKLTYVMGLFGPMMMFMALCDVCAVKIHKKLVVLMYSIQAALYICVCTTGSNTLFYKAVEYHVGKAGAYLTKTYGPVHTLYIISMYAYLIGSACVAIYAINKKNTVSTISAEIMLVANTLAIAFYLVERFVELDVELMPIVFTVIILIDMGVMTRQQMYNLNRNVELINDKLDYSAYIILSKKLAYMGCNETATKLFPELNDWALEKKIPGNGGRFNTFLRQPLMEYVRSGDKAVHVCKPFEFKSANYDYIIRPLIHGSNMHVGYILEITDITRIVKAEKEFENECDN